MKFVSYERGEGASYGLALEGGQVLDLQAAAQPGQLPATLAGFIAAGPSAMDTARRLQESPRAEAVYFMNSVRLTAPIPRPPKNVFCVGRNYKEHVAEGYRAAGAATKLPEYPQFFTKPPTAVIGPEDGFVHDPAVTRRLDYEVELAVVIGRAGRDIPRDRALEHVFGYTILNDITARDLQRRHDQWFKGKGLDRSCPMGPWIVTPDTLPELGAVELVCKVNGEERQRSTVNQMIFDIPEIIQQLSAGLTLEPGDIIATGTPSGVGYAMAEPQFLKAGDVVECAISGIGLLRTAILAPGNQA
ncbi:MAG: fumarylacetoacetate hydrolase family protein [Acetobacteraceae bacterium]|nr:fumarylacetoacetate hydrolase family protein [Acetobacteraceae bacterium]